VNELFKEITFGMFVERYAACKTVEPVTMSSNSVQLSPFSRSASCQTTEEFSKRFMEPKGSLPHSKEPANDPHPEPDQSIQYHPHHSSSLRLILILCTYLLLSLPSGLLPYGFSTQILHAFNFSLFVLHAPPISSFF
jgi:hypothetical protein